MWSLRVTTLLVLFLSACGGYSPITYQPVVVPDMLTKVTSNKNFKAVDNKSFAEAAMLYPTRTGKTHHIVPVGDYLLSRVVLGLPEDAGISNIRLEDYHSECSAKEILGPHLWCLTNARLMIAIGGRDRLIDLADEADVGPVFVPGDIAPPFTMGDNLEGPIHTQARATVDHLTAKLWPAFSKASSL
jgi:hypothetical protein